MDVTKTDNYTALTTAERTAVDAAVTAIKAAYHANTDKLHYDNINMVLREQLDSQEDV